MAFECQFRMKIKKIAEKLKYILDSNGKPNRIDCDIFDNTLIPIPISFYKIFD